MTLTKWFQPIFESFSRLNPAPAWTHEFKGYNRHKFQQDLLSGITVGVVALPLALAFGVTSGAGAAAGLFTAITAGFVAGVFGGSRFQVSGPTGAMTVVLLPIIARYGIEKIAVVGMMAALILLTLGLLRVGRFVQLIPWSVVTGFTNGIAIIIFLQQIPAFLGVTTPKGTNGILPTTFETVRVYLEQPSFWTIALSLFTISIMLFWARVSKRVPASIVALLVVVGISLILGLDVPRIGAIPTQLPLPQLPSFAWSDLSVLWESALAIALLSGVESLLSAVVADGITIQERHDPDRELIGQGLANLLSPLFGGIPATGAIARTAVNIRSGAQTRLSTIIHTIFLLSVVLILGRYAAVIPRAALAGILMFTAVRMIELEAVKALWKSTKSDLSTMLITTAVTLIFDLVLAIEVGLVVAGVLFIQRMAKSLKVEPLEVVGQLEMDHGLLRERVVAYNIEGPLFFAVVSEFLNTLLEISNVDALILRMQRVTVIDASGANVLKTIKDALERRGVKLLISGLQPQPTMLLEKMGLLDEITTERHHLFENTDQAIEHAWSHVVRNRTAL